jgi:hypothetical protein
VHPNPKKAYTELSSSYSTWRMRETDLLSPACVTLCRHSHCSVSRDLPVALRVRRGYAARRESARVLVFAFVSWKKRRLYHKPFVAAFFF